MASDQRPPSLLHAIWLADAFSFIYILSMLYLMLLVLIPKLLFRSRLLLFGLCFFLIIVAIYLVVWVLDF
ncbi:MAG: hypothetical protein WKI04_18480 [Ferruginibacter sp.]